MEVYRCPLCKAGYPSWADYYNLHKCNVHLPGSPALEPYKPKPVKDAPTSDKAQAPDPVDNPEHYTAGGIETIDYLKAKLTPEHFEGFLVGNILKYISRYSLKNGLQDLKKARWYLERLIQEKE